MQSNRSGLKLWVLGLVAILLLSLPLAVAAQTTGGTSGASTAASAATTNGITSPKDMAALSGTVEVRGFASSPNFMKWQLDLLPNGDPNAAIFLTLGTNEGAFTYSLDTTNLPAGEHALRLRVVRQDSNYDEYLTRFTIGKVAAAGTGTTGSSGATTGGTSTSSTASASTSGGTATPSTGAGATGTTAATTRGTTTGGTATTAATSGAGVTMSGLAAPREGQAINGDFVVRGFASDPNFMKWQLDLLPNGNSNSAAFLALGETPGVFTYTLSTANLPAGQHALRLRVVRNDSNYTEYTTNFTIGSAGAAATGGAGTTAAGSSAGGTATTSGTGSSGGANAGNAAAGTSTTEGAGSSAGAASGTVAQTNGISSPKEGAAVSGSVPVRGYADAPNFMKWQLDLLPNGEANSPVFLALGEKPGEFTYTLDTGNLPAGEHVLRLRVVRSDSNYDEYTTRFKIAK